MRISDWSSDVCSSDLFRFVTEKVPKPTKRTSSPFFRAPLMASKTPSTALLASLLLKPLLSATVPIRSCLFMPWEPPCPQCYTGITALEAHIKAKHYSPVKGRSEDHTSELKSPIHKS